MSATPFGAHDQIFITVGHLESSCCGAPSMTRGRVCNLLVQFTVSLGSKSRRTYGHILLSHLRLHQPGGPGPHIYIPQEQGGPVIPPGTGFPSCRLQLFASSRVTGNTLRLRYRAQPVNAVWGNSHCLL
jgi:hypothetical protein